MMITQRHYDRLNNEAYALYQRLSALWFASFYVDASVTDNTATTTRLYNIQRRAFARYVRRQQLPYRILVVPAAPAPIYSLEMGQVFATFADGTTWMQTGPEQWRLIASEVTQ